MKLLEQAATTGGVDIASASLARLAPGARASMVRRVQAPRAARLDPRWYQIAVLGTLLTYGIAWLGLDVDPWRVALILGTALLAQLAGTALGRAPRLDLRFDPK